MTAGKPPGTMVKVSPIAGAARNCQGFMETTLNDRFAVVQDDYRLENWQITATLLTEILGYPR